MVFLVFDSIFVKGVSQTAMSFRHRLATATRLVWASDDLQNSSMDDIEEQVLETGGVVLVHFDPPLTMRPKTFVERQHAERLWSERSEAEHRVDGLIIQDMTASYVTGAAEDGSVFKWKEHSTVDLKGPALHTIEKNPIPSVLDGRCVRAIQSQVSPRTSQDVVEYLIDVQEDEIRLMPIRMRPDKTTANSLRVVIATIDDVLHSITPEDIASV